MAVGQGNQKPAGNQSTETAIIHCTPWPPFWDFNIVLQLDPINPSRYFVFIVEKTRYQFNWLPQVGNSHQPTSTGTGWPFKVQMLSLLAEWHFITRPEKPIHSPFPNFSQRVQCRVLLLGRSEIATHNAIQSTISLVRLCNCRWFKFRKDRRQNFYK